MADRLQGVGVGTGIAIGPLYKMGRPPELPTERPVDDDETEAKAAANALATVSADLAARSLETTDSTASAVLDALSMIAADPTLHEQVDELIHSRNDAPHAVYTAFEGYRELLADAGGYLAERAADLGDIRDRVIAVLLGLPMPGLPKPGLPHILAADDLSPADTVGIDTNTVLALVTERGGTTSHTAILARSLGLPCIVACPGVMDIADGITVAVDVEAGTVEVEPETNRQRELQNKADEQLADETVRGPGATADGHRIGLLHNIGSVDDLDGRIDDDFEGVGLFRTEFLFLDRDTAPTFDEQRQAYEAVLSACGPRKVVVRTLDAGADKPLPFIDIDEGPNPALGVRGLRIAKQRPDILDTQLHALAAAGESVPASNLWVMAPMVATADEARDFCSAARAVGLTTVGVMIEIPAAALMAQQILDEVDFLSIGTNDLAQYTFAADRMEGSLAAFLDPWQPALLSLVAMCGKAGLALNKSVGICGEAASDPALAPVFVGLGITSLSMSARSVPAVRGKLSRWTLAECRAAAQHALGAANAQEARQARHRTRP
ncbi:MAG: phosphoenolpyruvate--protein phosphotransferase [Actinomycetota bacterium]|nr:phosphoenolpyruvate--protein phosphotransferase [Actinomycetota bacterium]